MEIELPRLSPTPQTKLLSGETAGETEIEVIESVLPDPPAPEQQEIAQVAELPAPPNLAPVQMAWEDNPIILAVGEYRDRNRGWVGFLKTALFLFCIGYISYRFLDSVDPDIHSCRQNPEIVVSKDGTADYTSISSAIQATPDEKIMYSCIFVRSGVYRENILIPFFKTNIMIVGEDMKRTIIESEYGATATVIGSGFVAVNVTFTNTGGPGEDVLALNSSSFTSAFYWCSFAASRTTIHFEEARRQFFRNCDIYGAESVISGDAIADFQNCSVYIGQSLGVDYNVVTLQLRGKPFRSTGFIFDHSRILPNLGSLPALNNTFLGFAGSDYSRVIFMDCFLSAIVNSAGWISNDSQATKTVYYAEFNNSGPGAATLNRVKWPGYRILDAKGASNFSLGAFFWDTEWLRLTGVPYWEDLRRVESVSRQLV